MRKFWSLRIGLLTAGLLGVFAAVAFANVLLSSHTGELGATWAQHPASASTAELTPAGRLRPTTVSQNTIYYTSGVPASANYTVEADVYVASQPTFSAAGVAGRMSTTADTYYTCRYASSANAWQLFKFVAGTATLLGTQSTQTLTTGSSYHVALEMVGSALACRVDGTIKVSATDSAITAAGRAGVRMHSSSVTDTTGFQLDNFTASDPFVRDTFTNAAPTPTPTPTPPPSGCTGTDVTAPASIQTAINNATAGSTLCLHGAFSSANISVNKTLTLDGGSPMASVTQTTVGGALFSVSASNTTVKNLSMTGQSRGWNNNDCASPRTQLIYVSANGSSITNNSLHSACGGVTIDSVSSASVTLNTVDNMSYYGIDINSGGGSTSVPILVDQNTVTNTRVDGSLDDNAYGIVASGSPVPHDVAITNNRVDQAPTWECLDTHGGIRVNFLNNTCINAGRQPIVASGATVSRIEGNTLDAADRTSVWNGMINTGADVAGNSMIGNTITNYAGSCAVGSAYYAPNFSGNSARFNSNTCSP